jgi:hypothetical protein
VGEGPRDEVECDKANNCLTRHRKIPHDL